MCTVCTYLCISELICSLIHTQFTFVHCNFQRSCHSNSSTALLCTYVHTSYIFLMCIHTYFPYIQLSYFLYVRRSFLYYNFPICTALLLCTVFHCAYRAFPVYFPNTYIALLYSLPLVKITCTYVRMLCTYVHIL